MQLRLATNVHLDENENEKYIYMIHLEWYPKIDENVVIYMTWKVVHKPLDITWYLFNLICDYKSYLHVQVIKSEKNESANEIARFNVLIFFP
jgi:hypothetical protein